MSQFGSGRGQAADGGVQLGLTRRATEGETDVGFGRFGGVEPAPGHDDDPAAARCHFHIGQVSRSLTHRCIPPAGSTASAAGRVAGDRMEQTRGAAVQGAARVFKGGGPSAGSG
jgi:hypothetical protein